MSKAACRRTAFSSTCSLLAALPIFLLRLQLFQKVNLFPQRPNFFHCLFSVSHPPFTDGQTGILFSLRQFSLNRMPVWPSVKGGRSEEHTAELQSRENIVCRLLLRKQ